jgi:hypothetical protein
VRLLVVFLAASCGSATTPPTESAQPLPAHVEPAPSATAPPPGPIVEIGTATIDLKTPGAKVELVSGNDRRDIPHFPLAIKIDTKQTWTIVATKPGYRDYVQPIRFDDAAEKTFVIELVPK